MQLTISLPSIRLDSSKLTDSCYSVILDRHPPSFFRNSRLLTYLADPLSSIRLHIKQLTYTKNLSPPSLCLPSALSTCSTSSAVGHLTCRSHHPNHSHQHTLLQRPCPRTKSITSARCKYNILSQRTKRCTLDGITLGFSYRGMSTPASAVG